MTEEYGAAKKGDITMDETKTGASGADAKETIAAIDEAASLSFEDILRDELLMIAAGRDEVGLGCAVAGAAPDPISEAQQAGLMGLALSGGGIRSATFGLGVLQALAEMKLLRRFDYLSTVSGGGYAGSWLSAWIHRERGGVRGVEEELGPRPAESGDHAEAPQVQHLRQYANYLTPKLGLLSADTLTGIATYLRNLFLNLLILAGVLGAVLLLPRLIVWGAAKAALPFSTQLYFGAAYVLFLWSGAWAGKNLTFGKLRQGGKWPWYTQGRWIAGIVVLPLVFAALSAALGLWAWGLEQLVPALKTAQFARAHSQEESAQLLRMFALAVGLGALGYAAPWAIAAMVSAGKGGAGAASGPGEEPFHWGAALLTAPLAGACGGALFFALAWLFAKWQLSNPHMAVWHVVGMGTLLVLFALSLGVVLHIGLMGRKYSEETREWWSRLGALVMRVGAIWGLVFAAAVYGPMLVIWLREWIAEFGAAWLAATVSGLLAAKSPSTGTHDNKRWMELLARIAPYVFVAGALLAAAYGTHAMLNAAADGPPLSCTIWERCHFAGYWANVYPAALDKSVGDPGLLAGIFAGCLMVALLFGWRVDVNVFSFHMFYRNRLARCYLGASNAKRSPHAFTGFDPTDSPGLAALSCPQPESGKAQAQRPYHIINAALNMTSGDNLAWQERKAGSFVFTPNYCGYEMREGGGVLHAYQATDQYVSKPMWGPRGWMALATPMTISGAAVSPNAGYHSNPATAFLMTVFNVRLGWWLQNTRYRDVWRKPGPRLGIKHLIRELAGASDAKSKFIYLSDGGHFENLGLYELVRRRCRFIVVCDAGMDDTYSFEDLGNAVRKCRIDFGVGIDIDTSAIAPKGDDKRSLYHCTMGVIRYDQADSDALPGFLLYIKPTLTGNEPADVRHYVATHPDFPHESTADQWFGESQFESYRSLGYHIAKTVLEQAWTDAKKGEETPGKSADERLFVALQQRWYPPSSAVAASFGKHAEELQNIFHSIRTEKNLDFMDWQIYPEWDKLVSGVADKDEHPKQLWLPDRYEQVQAGFYLCNTMMQLMENVYLDLNLEEQWHHPDNRGWVNLFRHWSWSGMFRVTWAICAGTYGARFQNFCHARLGLEIPEIVVDRGNEARLAWHGGTSQFTPWSDSERERIGLNFEEARRVQNILKRTGEHLSGTIHVVSLKLLIRNPRPGDTPAQAHDFSFGFAMVLENADEAGAPCLIYFRVRDHLRRMGLGRKALRCLLEVKEWPGLRERISEDIASIDPEVRLRRFRTIFHSVRREAGTAQEGRVTHSPS